MEGFVSEEKEFKLDALRMNLLIFQSRCRGHRF